jgi:hypothetical protein
MNTNLTSLQETFVKDNVDVRLRNLSAHLKLIQSLSKDSSQIQVVNKLITESRYFTEWIAPDIDIDNAFELANLGRFLTRWLFHWEHIWHDTAAKNQIIQELDTWSESILRMSQLFLLQSY